MSSFSKMNMIVPGGRNIKHPGTHTTIAMGLRDHFDDAVKYLSQLNISLHEVIKKYNKKDMRLLLRKLSGDSGRDVKGSILRYLERCIAGKKVLRIEKGHRTYRSMRNENNADDIIAVFGAEFKDLPLFINGTDLQKEIIKWRLEIGK